MRGTRIDEFCKELIVGDKVYCTDRLSYYMVTEIENNKITTMYHTGDIKPQRMSARPREDYKNCYWLGE